MVKNLKPFRSLFSSVFSSVFRPLFSPVLCSAMTSMLLLACSSTSELDDKFHQSHTPKAWSKNQLNQSELGKSDVGKSEVGKSELKQGEVKKDWLNQLKDPQINHLVDLALNNNFQLKQQAMSVEIAGQQLIVAGSDLWPSLDLTLSDTRRKSTSQSTPYSTSLSLDLNLKFELDLWGKLSAADQQANLALLAQQASFEQTKQQLVADVVTAWYAVIEASQLVDLYQQRTENTRQNLASIESGYQQGLNSALDVYLTRNEVNNEMSRTSEQRSKKRQAIRQLELLLGQYPEGTLDVISGVIYDVKENAEHPFLQSVIPLGLPAELISRKPALRASWYQLLAKDAALAYAHKQRFPRLSITASVNNKDSDLSDFLWVSSLGWSLLGNLTAPIFNAGKFAANEEKARLILKQSEQSYLDTLYGAFAEVENAVTREASLKQRYQMMLKAQDNAIAAQTLSFEQYQGGLVNYITVLDSQSRSYDAQSTVIQIKHQLIANRIKLHVALGGDFSSATTGEKAE